MSLPDSPTPETSATGQKPPVPESSTPPATPERNQRRLVLGTAVAAMAAGAGIGVWQARLDQPAPEAPDFFFSLSYPVASPENEGKNESTATKFKLADLRGKAIVANFWATWCPPCIEEMPELSSLAEKWATQYAGKVAVVGLAVESFARVQRFSSQKPVKYPLIATDAQGLGLLTQLGNEAGGLPFTVLISPQGVIAERILGRFKGPALEQSLKKLLA